MTPLAHRIVKELTLPKARRTFRDFSRILDMSDIHCFECSDIIAASRAVGWNGRVSPERNNHILRSMAEATGFLPAPKTWIEFADPLRRNRRRGILLIEDGDQALGIPVEGDQEFYSAPATFMLRLKGTAKQNDAVSVRAAEGFASLLDGAARAEVIRLASNCVPLLAMINTPRIIGRRQHMPHAGLERKLARSMGGKFPLHAWTEIKLEVRPPDISEGENEAHLTGARALHFCRAHLRIRLGRLELVSAHWRGDPALGIKQSRYKLVA